MPAAATSSPRVTRSHRRALPENGPAPSAADKDDGSATPSRGRSGIQSTPSGRQRRPLATKTNTASRNAALPDDESQELGMSTKTKRHDPGPPPPAAGRQGEQVASLAAPPATSATARRRSNRSMSEAESIDSDLERELLLNSQQQPPTRLSSFTGPAPRVAKVSEQAAKTQVERSAPAAAPAVAGPSRVPPIAQAPPQRKHATPRPPSRQRSIDSLAEFDAEWVEESRDAVSRSAIIAASTAQQQKQQKRATTPTSAARRELPGSQQRVPRASTPVPGRSYLDDQMLYGAGDNDDLPPLLAARRTPSISSSAARGRRQHHRGSDHPSARKRRPDSPSPSTASKNRRRLLLPALGSDALEEEMTRTKEARTAAFVRSASKAMAGNSQSAQHQQQLRTPAGASAVQGSARKAVERSGAGSKTSRKGRRKARDDDSEEEADEGDPFGFFRAEERIKRRRLVSVVSAALERQEQGGGGLEAGGGGAADDGLDLRVEDDDGVAETRMQIGEQGAGAVAPQGPQDDELPEIRDIIAQSNAVHPSAGGAEEDDDAVLRRILGSADASSDPPRAPEKSNDDVNAVGVGQGGNAQASGSSSDTDDYIAPGGKRAGSKTPFKSKRGAAAVNRKRRKNSAPPPPRSAQRQQPRRGSRRPPARSKDGEGSDAIDSSDSGETGNKWRVDNLMDSVLPRRHAANTVKKASAAEEQKKQKRARFEDDEDEDENEEESLLGPVWSSPSSSPQAKGNAKGKKGKGKGASKKAGQSATTKRKAASTTTNRKGRSPRTVTAAATRVSARGKKNTAAAAAAAATAATSTGAGAGILPSSSPTPHMTYDPDDDDDDPDDDAGSTTRHSTSAKSTSPNYGRKPPSAEQLEDRRRRGDDGLEGYEFEEELVLD